jgi:23S rRNA (guanosine2251-2'-O)-methyltransferase
MRETLDRMAGGVPHQGIIAVVSEKPALSLEDLLASAREPALLVVLDGVEDPRNLGAILRTAEAAGADGVLVPDRHSAGLSETVGRASAGAIEHVRVARVGNLVQALGTLKSRGIWVLGFDTTGRERWDAVDLKRPVALVLGGEGRGIRRLVREHCDHLVSIPHFGHVSSLNVSVAAGIALYEAVRQRGAVPSLVRPIPVRPAGVPQIIGPGPDDPEMDPGAAPGQADLGRDVAPGDEAPAELDPAPITHVDIHEDVAWGQGPTVLKPVGFQGRLRLRRGRRAKGAPRRPPPADTAEEQAAPASAHPDGPPEASGRPQGGRRRRRRRGRGEVGGPVAGGAPGAPLANGAPKGSSPSPGDTGSPDPVAGAHRRRRRRWRRRRR